MIVSGVNNANIVSLGGIRIHGTTEQRTADMNRTSTTIGLGGQETSDTVATTIGPGDRETSGMIATTIGLGGHETTATTIAFGGQGTNSDMVGATRRIRAFLSCTNDTTIGTTTRVGVEDRRMISSVDGAMTTIVTSRRGHHTPGRKDTFRELREKGIPKVSRPPEEGIEAYT